MNTGGIGLRENAILIEHDCVACEGLIQKFGTCEYMHQANPSRCTCKFTALRSRENVQSVLQSESTDRARIRYWMKWLRNQEWFKEGVAQDGTSSSQDRRQSTLDDV